MLCLHCRSCEGNLAVAGRVTMHALMSWPYHIHLHIRDTCMQNHSTEHQCRYRRVRQSQANRTTNLLLFPSARVLHQSCPGKGARQGSVIEILLCSGHHRFFNLVCFIFFQTNKPDDDDGSCHNPCPWALSLALSLQCFLSTLPPSHMHMYVNGDGANTAARIYRDLPHRPTAK